MSSQATPIAEQSITVFCRLSQRQPCQPGRSNCTAPRKDRAAAFSEYFPLSQIEPQHMRTCLAPVKGEINHEAQGLHKPQVTSFGVLNRISGRALSGGRESLRC